MLTHNLFIFLY